MFCDHHLSSTKSKCLNTGIIISNMGVGMLEIHHFFWKGGCSGMVVDSLEYFPAKMDSSKAMQSRFFVSPLGPTLRPATSTVIVAFQTMTHPLLKAVVLWCCQSPGLMFS